MRARTRVCVCCLDGDGTVLIVAHLIILPPLPPPPPEKKKRPPLLNGNITPIEEKVWQYGILPHCFIYMTAYLGV